MRLVVAAIASLLPVACAQSPSPAPPNVVTNVQTSAELAAICDPAWSGVPRLEAIAYCQGFITSAGQYHTLLHPAGGPRPLFCLPSPAPTIAQSGLAFSAWMRANPTHSSEPALDGFLRWAQATYPCGAPAAAPRATRPGR
jgi:Rap1a immunity proteins